MKTDFVIIRTKAGNEYADKIAGSLSWINRNIYPGLRFNVNVITRQDITKFFNRKDVNPDNTIVHVRAAHPIANWMDELQNLEDEGYKMVNSIKVLRLTSDKLACALALQKEFPDFHPVTYTLNRIDKLNPNDYPEGKYVIKPYTSISQGALVTQWVNIHNNEDSNKEFYRVLDIMDNDICLLQQFIDYNEIYRVIVINGEPLPYAFVDRVSDHPDNWKVSVCLNKTSMKFEPHPSTELLNLASKVQTFIGGEINFIDIFGTNNGFVLSEINTACNLTIHEGLANEAGEREWNIHYKIARYLTKKAGA